MKLGIIGCGKIAEYHLASMKKAGFELHSISGTNNSLNAIKLSKKFKIKKVYSSSHEHIKSKEYDALLFLTPNEVTYKYLLSVDKSTKILAEKPITFYTSKLKKLRKNKNIKVAFNRRQYNSIELIKSKIDKKEIFLIDISIPEKINNINKTKKSREEYFNIFNNSIHIFDIIKYLVGKYSVESVINLKDKKNNSQGYVVYIASQKVKKIIIKSIFNSPENFSLIAYSNNIIYETCPIEIFRKYKGTKVIEPSSNYPLRRYLPIMIENREELINLNSKPGFDKQAKAFFSFCNKKKTNLANLDDLFQSLMLAEKIFKNL